MEHLSHGRRQKLHTEARTNRRYLVGSGVGGWVGWVGGSDLRGIIDHNLEEVDNKNQVSERERFERHLCHATRS